MYSKKILTYLTYSSLFVCALVITSVGTALPNIKETFSADEQRIGMFIFSFSLGSLISVLISGYLVDLIKIKPVYVLGQFLLAAGCLFFSLANNIFWGEVAYFFIGIAWGLLEVSTNTLIANLYLDTKGASLNLLHVYFGVGAILGPIFCSKLLQLNLHWHLVFLIIAFISFWLVLILMTSAFPEITSEKTNFKKFFNTAKNFYTILLGIAIASYAGLELSINNLLVSFFEKIFSAKNVLASYFLSSFWLAMTVGRFICVYLEHRFGEIKVLMFISFFAFLTFILFIASPNIYLSGFFIVICGFFLSGIFATIIALGTIKFPQNSGTINGLLMAFACIGLTVVAPLVGIINQKTNIKTGLSLGIILLFLVFLLPIVAEKKHLIIRRLKDEKLENYLKQSSKE